MAPGACRRAPARSPPAVRARWRRWKIASRAAVHARRAGWRRPRVRPSPPWRAGSPPITRRHGGARDAVRGCSDHRSRAFGRRHRAGRRALPRRQAGVESNGCWLTAHRSHRRGIDVACARPLPIDASRAWWPRAAAWWQARPLSSAVARRAAGDLVHHESILDRCAQQGVELRRPAHRARLMGGCARRCEPACARARGRGVAQRRPISGDDLASIRLVCACCRPWERRRSGAPRTKALPSRAQDRFSSSRRQRLKALPCCSAAMTHAVRFVSLTIVKR